MKQTPLHPSPDKDSFHEEAPEWDIRPVRKHDLVRVAGWISTLMGSRTGREDEITACLCEEWNAGRASSYASYYLVTLYGQPLMHITAINPKKDLVGELREGIMLHLLVSPAYQSTYVEQGKDI